ncbi:DUF294 nucleotidyltransferase-like domain-containing protein [Anditalea andensis]|uniref:Histidine kinase n=1 Tax=Anditalea andensis TaxID=1048983 RepID=A0A074KZD6_9BACT|nr:DUF294 nucleotidyltransferase-like domain-containing protein [Anditalea andensis]KEO73565.1 histidine kinase [Anditalea andensis]
MSNVIVNRVKEFLRRFPPFTFLDEKSLEHVSTEVEVRYYGQGDKVFGQGEPAQNFFFVIKEGSVKLTENQNGESKVREICDEGDVFGVLALLGKRPYILNAQAYEDTLIYAIPVAVFEKILEENSSVSLYFAAGFASGQVVIRSELSQSKQARKLLTPPSQEDGLMIFTGQSNLNYSKDVLTSPMGVPTHVAVKKMAEKGVGSIVIVSENQFPLGIITDKDLRNNLIAQNRPYDTPVEMIMTSPVLTHRREETFANLYLTMIKNRLHHLIFTEDGTDQSKVTGLVSDHDILLSQGNNPAVIINAILNTWDINEMAVLRSRSDKLLKHYLENEISIDFIAKIMSEINDILIVRAVTIAIKKWEKVYPKESKIKFSFLLLGSEGREEQLLRTDLDNAIVFEDVPADELPKVQEYMLLIGQEVIEILLTCGFHPCPADMMASNPKWCQPLSRWKKYFTTWITNPEAESLLAASIFFDFRNIYGSTYFAEEMIQHIYEEIEGRQIFLNFLAKNAYMNPAPLGFFREFVVEKSGEHRDKFDIKMRAMMPLVDISRLLVLSKKVIGVNNTFKRFEKLAELEPQNKRLFEEAGEAYEIMMRMRALEGLRSSNSGRFLDPKSLGKIQRQLLRNAFEPINDLHKLIRTRFQLDYFG